MLRNIGILFILSLVLSGCAGVPGQSVEQRRASVHEMSSETISLVEKSQSNIRQKMADAPGYAVFHNANVNIILASFSGGYGMVHDNRNGTDTYMKMAEAGVGVGMGVKDFRAVFIFRSAKALDSFVNHGWVFGAHADAAIKANDKGASASAEMVVDNIEIYLITKSGLALQATVKGTKYWPDDALN